MKTVKSFVEQIKEHGAKIKDGTVDGWALSQIWRAYSACNEATRREIAARVGKDGA